PSWTQPWTWSPPTPDRRHGWRPWSRALQRRPAVDSLELLSPLGCPTTQVVGLEVQGPRRHPAPTRRPVRPHEPRPPSLPVAVRVPATGVFVSPRTST